MIERTPVIDVYERHIKSIPSWYMDATELNEVVEYYEDHGMQVEAENCLRQALALHPNDESLLVKRAYILRSKGEIDKAEHIIATLSEQNLDVRFFRAEEALAQFNVTEASRIFNRIIDEDSKSSPDWRLRIEIAECYFSEGFINEARETVLSIPDSAKESKDAHVLLSECYFSVHDLPQAIDEMNKALDIDPYDVANWGMLAEMHYECCHYAECQDACQYALAIKNTDERALRISYFAYAVSMQIDKALQQADTYIHNWPNEYYLPMNAGELCAAEGKMIDALKYLGLANRNCPDQHQDRIRIISNVARIQAQQGYFEESFRTLKCACACGSKYNMVCIQMADLAAEMGNIPYAAERLNEVLPDIKACNTEICSAVLNIMRDYQMLFIVCPEITSTLQKISTNIS